MKHPAFATTPVARVDRQVFDENGKTLRHCENEPAVFVPRVHYFVEFALGNKATYGYRQFGELLYPIGDIIAEIERRVPRMVGADVSVASIQAFIPFRILTTTEDGREYRTSFYTPDELARWRDEQPEIAARMADLRVVNQLDPLFGPVNSPGHLTLDSWMRQFDIELF